MTLGAEELAEYTSKQLNHFFPDNHPVRPILLKRELDLALDRLAHCFKHSTLDSYCLGGDPVFNHLFTAHYVMFLWFLSNTIRKSQGASPLADKLYYLNKALHGFDCLYDTALPDIFLISYAAGTTLGKAQYGDFLTVGTCCTVGASNGRYPVIGRAVGLAPHSSVIGGCNIGDLVSIGTGTTVFEMDVPPRSLVFRDKKGALQVQPSVNPLSLYGFNLGIRSELDV